MRSSRGAGTSLAAAPALETGRAPWILNRSATIWWIAAILGQWAFLYYIARVYGPTTLTGNFAAWARNHDLVKGYVRGDTVGNLSFGTHALMAGAIAFGGTLQLIPWIRSRALAFHRWNGRLFMMTAIGVSLTGFYMVWVRHATTTLIGAFAISGNGALIILFAVLAWRAALAGTIESHRRWALRTFMVANGQWFFRVGIFAWILINRGPFLLGDNLDGPVAYLLSFGCYLVPLALLELYLRAKESKSAFVQFATASAIGAATAYMSIGMFAFTMLALRIAAKF
jgi:hypothetical protein